jgi:hypothetical protein
MTDARGIVATTIQEEEKEELSRIMLRRGVAARTAAAMDGEETWREVVARSHTSC